MMPVETLLAIFDALPALRGRGGEADRRDGKPAHWAMPFRHLYSCEKCGLRAAEVLHELQPGEAGAAPIRFRESELHHVRCHGGAFSDEVAQFLLRLHADDDETR